MMLLLSGEGPSDLGTIMGTVSICEGELFKRGPMSIIVDQMVEQRLGYSLLNSNAVCFVNEHEIGLRSKQVSIPRSPRLPGQKVKKDTIYFRRNAQALGTLARDLEVQRECPIIAVLFRDSDGTNTSTRSLWRDKFDSIVGGFEDAEFASGVPMMPKPKSEAWLLCALKQNPYTHCDALENSSGNDASPNSLKKQLAAVVNGDVTSEKLSDWVGEGHINHVQIDMPSFNAFLHELVRAMNNALAR